MSQSDVRYSITALQSLALGLSRSVSFLDVAEKLDLKQLSKNAWSVVPAMFKPPPSSLMIGKQKPWIYDRMNDYFVDDLVPLMVQENYLFSEAPFNVPVNQRLQNLAVAAQSFSESDIIGRSIMEDQSWHLMPCKAITSCIYPGVKVSGDLKRTDFPQFLGKYSKTSKFKRIFKYLSLRSYPVTLAGSTSFSLDYLPYLLRKLTLPISVQSDDVSAGLDSVVELMEKYQIDRDDWGFFNNEYVFPGMSLPSVEPKVKAKLTRTLKAKGVMFDSIAGGSDDEEKEVKPKEKVVRKTRKPATTKKKKAKT
ncbi:hypothetical protein GEMRC1_002023 [Eukaryota sp. GEM-RC1]